MRIKMKVKNSLCAIVLLLLCSGCADVPVNTVSSSAVSAVSESKAIIQVQCYLGHVSQVRIFVTPGSGGVFSAIIHADECDSNDRT